MHSPLLVPASGTPPRPPPRLRDCPVGALSSRLSRRRRPYRPAADTPIYITQRIPVLGIRDILVRIRRSADPYHRHPEPALDPDPALFLSSFQDATINKIFLVAHFYLMVHLHQSVIKKLYKSRFFLFLLILLDDGRIRNRIRMWIQKGPKNIRIRIPNTAEYNNQISASQQLPKKFVSIESHTLFFRRRKNFLDCTVSYSL